MWDMTPFLDALWPIAPAVVRERDPEGLRKYLHWGTLNHAQRRPQHAIEVGHRLRDFTGGFVYDREAALVIPCQHADHEYTAGALAALRQLAWPLDWDEAIYTAITPEERWAEMALERGWVVVVNSPRLSGDGTHRWPARLGSEVRLTAQEKLWFRGFELIRDD
jgi:hypothetical protein